MQVFLIASERTGLQIIWLTALALLVLSAVFDIVLILFKVHNNKRKQKRQQRYQFLKKTIFMFLYSPIQISTTDLPALTASDVPIVCQIALDILRTIRGLDQLRLVELIKNWQIETYINELLREGQRGECVQALTLLSYFSDQSSLVLLLKYVDHPDPYLQLTALRGLAERNAIDYLPHISSVLLKSKQRNILMLAEILTRFGELAVPFLGNLAQQQILIEIRIAALIALGNIGALVAAEYIRPLSNDASPVIRKQVMIALGKLSDFQASALLGEALSDTDAEVRAEAAKTIGLLGLKDFILLLTRLLRDQAWLVRYQAAVALIHLGSQGIAVLRAFSSQASTTGLIAAQVLAEKEL